MFFLKKKQPDQPPPPAWLTWGVLVFILLAILLNLFGVKPENAPPITLTKTHTTQDNSAINWSMFDIDTYKARLMPGYGRLQIHEKTVGDGQVALCGQTVEVAYEALTQTDRDTALVPQTPPEGDKIKTPEATQATFRLGDVNGAPEGLQAGILGMRAGGEREVVVPAERTPDGQSPLRYRITLKEATPSFDAAPKDATLPLKSFDRRQGLAQSIACGETVRIHLTLWDASGKQLFSTTSGAEKKPIEFTLGDGSMMVGLEQGLLEMQADSQRTLIIPPYLQKPLLEKPTPFSSESPEKIEAENTTTDAVSAVQNAGVLHSVAFPEAQVIIADVELAP